MLDGDLVATLQHQLRFGVAVVTQTGFDVDDNRRIMVRNPFARGRA